MNSNANESDVISSPPLAKFLISDHLARRTNPSYVHFWVDDFLPATFDSELRSEYPTDLMISRLKNRLSVNLNFHDGSSETRAFLESSAAWQRYYEVFTSQAWLETTIRTFRREFVRRYPLALRPLLAAQIGRAHV